MENNEIRHFRDLIITEVSCVTAPNTQMCEVPFMYGGTRKTVKRSLKMYYVTFYAKNEFEDHACVVMTEDFGKISTIHDYLCQVMESGEKISEISGYYNNTHIIDVQTIVPKKFTFYV